MVAVVGACGVCGCVWWMGVEVLSVVLEVVW